jgi:hypothetical protein
VLGCKRPACLSDPAGVMVGFNPALARVAK